MYRHIKHLNINQYLIYNGMHKSFLLLIFFLQYYYIVEKYLQNWIRRVIYYFIHLNSNDYFFMYLPLEDSVLQCWSWK